MENEPDMTPVEWCFFAMFLCFVAAVAVMLCGCL